MGSYSYCLADSHQEIGCALYTRKRIQHLAKQAAVQRIQRSQQTQVPNPFSLMNNAVNATQILSKFPLDFPVDILAGNMRHKACS